MRASAEATLARRRRAVAAMGLGPLWVARDSNVGDIASDPESAAGRSAAIATMDRPALTVAVERCRACALGSTRVRTVFGDGPERAAWLLVGVAPDADDEAAATAYANGSGRLLDAMLVSIGRVRHADAFTTHRVKCRPPDDRRPSSDEIAACRPFLERQRALVDASFVVSLGGSETDGDAVVPEPRDLVVRPERKAEAWTALVAARRLSDARRAAASADPSPSAAGYGGDGA